MNDTAARKLALKSIEGAFAVCKLSHDASIPAWATTSGFFSITRTSDELSIVCAESVVPEGIQSERGWLCVRVVGSMAFTEIGVLASLVGPLAAAGVSVFAISTFDTDYLLVKEKDWADAMAELRQVGHELDGGHL